MTASLENIVEGNKVMNSCKRPRSSSHHLKNMTLLHFLNAALILDSTSHLSGIRQVIYETDKFNQTFAPKSKKPFLQSSSLVRQPDSSQKHYHFKKHFPT